MNVLLEENDKMGQVIKEFNQGKNPQNEGMSKIKNELQALINKY